VINAVARADEVIERAARCMSLMGHSHHFDRAPVTSGSPLRADVLKAGQHVSNVPQPDLLASAQRPVGDPTEYASTCRLV
jgi:hypothetical protein